MEEDLFAIPGFTAADDDDPNVAADSDANANTEADPEAGVDPEPEAGNLQLRMQRTTGQ